MSGESSTPGRGGLVGNLVDGLQNLVGAVGERAAAALSEKVGKATDRLVGKIGEDGSARRAAAAAATEKLRAGESPVEAVLSAGVAGGKEQLKHVVGKGEEKRKDVLKVTNIVEWLDVGVPVRLVYDQWTQFEDFPSFMKKVENVEREEDNKLTWKAQVFWSHRTWQSTIIEQVPDERIVWRSTGDKGTVDGAVSFHELAPDLTRMVVVLEYHPQGFVERVGNLWRAPGRRARLELKHFVRHVMTETVLHPDEVRGWRGEIRDGQVVQDDESARREEREDQDDESARREEREDQDAAGVDPNAEPGYERGRD